MRKWFILFLLTFLLPLNVDALTFNKCNTTYEIDDSNYQYSFYYFDDTIYNNYFVAYKDNNIYYIVTSSYSSNFPVSASYALGFTTIRNYPVKKCFINNNNTLTCSTTNTSVNFFSTGSTFPTDATYSNIFSNHLRQSTSWGSISVKSNLTKQDILDYYNDCPVIPEYQTKNKVVVSFINEFIPLIPFIIVLSLVFTALGMFLNKKD